MPHHIDLHLYDSHPDRATARQQWLQQPLSAQVQQLNTQEEQLSFWLSHPEQPVSYQGSNHSHLTWQRFFTTWRYWLGDRVPNDLPFQDEIQPTVKPLSLQAAPPLTPSERLLLRQLLMMDKQKIALLHNPEMTLQWHCDEQTTEWFNPHKERWHSRSHLQKMTACRSCRPAPPICSVYTALSMQ